MEVVEIMQGGGNSLGPAAAIYEECSFLASNFISILFYHRPREANVAKDFPPGTKNNDHAREP